MKQTMQLRLPKIYDNVYVYRLPCSNSAYWHIAHCNTTAMLHITYAILSSGARNQPVHQKVTPESVQSRVGWAACKLAVGNSWPVPPDGPEKVPPATTPPPFSRWLLIWLNSHSLLDQRMELDNMCDWKCFGWKFLGLICWRSVKKSQVGNLNGAGLFDNSSTGSSNRSSFCHLFHSAPCHSAVSDTTQQ